ncbi:MAG: MarR family transcriptional regulator [Anaerostipes sp.]|jgi:DNA-binding MarR family transcriptional regulator|nr:MarR family transcriptional regulator [Anaerostipes sp.]MDD3745146.1 MarR family transcriptional regulator [Anaerostipes sp.]
MNQREVAIEVLDKMQGSCPNQLFQKINDFDHGIIFVCMYLDCQEQEVIAGDIANEMKVSTARVATLLKKMEQRHLIRKYHSPKDARKTVVEITEEGKSFVEGKREKAISKMEHIIDEVGKEEMEVFIETLHKIGKAVAD